MVERILILGITGVAKDDALNQLEKYAESQAPKVSLRKIRFEKECLSATLTTNNLSKYGYLDEDNLKQRDCWLQAWDRFINSINEYQEQYLLLSLHGVITRDLTGTRSPIDFQSLIKFSPTKVITLIDDVYMFWCRTKGRANGIGYRGQPTLEQLLDARRAEIFLGDLIANHLQIKHYLLPIRHPARTLYRLLVCNPEELKPVYLSFPISAPRKKLKTGDSSGIQEINSFIKLAAHWELRSPKLVCFCPLTIDELPLVYAQSETGDKSGELLFSLENKWDLKEVWGERIFLYKDETIPPSIAIPRDEVKFSEGLIRTDVKLRDYRFVRQAKYVAVFNPWFDGKESTGVRNEIHMAVYSRKIPVYIYQDPRHDINGEAKERYSPTLKGALGNDPALVNTIFVDSVNDLFQQILKD